MIFNINFLFNYLSCPPSSIITDAAKYCLHGKNTNSERAFQNQSCATGVSTLLWTKPDRSLKYDGDNNTAGQSTISLNLLDRSLMIG